jgi:ubiquinone/menaquinone biosynthesis C-methylase UbiE
MKIQDPNQTSVLSELELILSELPLKGSKILELGCGRAEKTRAIAQTGLPEKLVALEVDIRQHEKNLTLEPLPGVEFTLGGAEAIPFDDNRFDFVVMFKSFHHVPVAHMGTALSEIRRVLKPGGAAWISEPVFAGDFNEIMRIFHDEKTVREAAFQAVRNAVDEGLFSLRKQMFFNVRNQFKDFDDFDSRMIQVTHSDHQLSDETYAEVRNKFDSFLTLEGARFLTPQRVDLLEK